MRSARRYGAWLGCAAIAAAAATPARADVFEVADDGRVTTAGAAAEAPAVPDAALTPAPADGVPAAYRAALDRAAADAGLSPALVAALVHQESGWRTDAVSPRGATGLAQLMPGTARDLRVDPRDPGANLAGGARYLRALYDRFDGDIEHALAAYNAGPARRNALTAIPETRRYVAAIADRLSRTALEGR